MGEEREVEGVKRKEGRGGRGVAMSCVSCVWCCVQVLPEDHAVGEMDFDVVVGGDGKRSILPGFDRKEFRGKLALAITANFVNYFTKEESAVEEISGVARIFNQKFFKELNEELGIDLENIVYYRNETHYFVMTAKKQSLLNKGVLKEVGGASRQRVEWGGVTYISGREG